MLKSLLKFLYPGITFAEPAPPTTVPGRDDSEQDDDGALDTRPGEPNRRAGHAAYRIEQPKGAPGITMDSAAYGAGTKLNTMRSVVPESLLDWYAAQTFIGYNTCAFMAQHWLIDKLCRMPGEDAIRQGYELKADNQEIIDRVKEFNKKHGLDKNLREMIHMGRLYGGRLVLFRVMHTDPKYYEKPFNIDAVGRGMYLGLSQIDPQWISPEMTGPSLYDPASPNFYEPEFYIILGRRYHRSHFHKYVPYSVPDILKPRYNYMGVSVPQRVYERVYNAERTANEAPVLTMTKRLNVLQVGAQAMARFKTVVERLWEWCTMRDNNGVLVIGEKESITQHDVSLADLDAVIMTQYQLVAAVGSVPGTKLMGTTPKGFNASGEYEEATYRETLESIQTNEFIPLMDKHHEILARSEGIPGTIVVTFEPLDSPTATEWATINKTKADTDKVYLDSGVITAEDVQERITSDKNSDYHGMEFEPELIDETLLNEIEQEAPAMGGGALGA